MLSSPAMHDPGADLAVPDDLGEQLLPEPVTRQGRLGAAARARAKRALPQQFWLVSSTDLHKPWKGQQRSFHVIGVITVVDVVWFSQLAVDSAWSSEGAWLLHAVASQGLNIETDFLCWRVSSFQPHTPRVALPHTAVAKWRGVVLLPTSVPEVEALHREWVVKAKTRRTWVLESHIADGLLEQRPWLPTAEIHARLAGVPLPKKPKLAQAPARDNNASLVSVGEGSARARIARGWCRHKYSPLSIASALRLHWNIRNSCEVSLSEVIKMSWRVSLPPCEWTRLEEQLASGALRIPSRSVLNAATVKMDIMYSVWQRCLLQKSRSWRYIVADSSPIKYAFFCVREDRLSWPAAFGDGDVLGTLPQDHYCSTHLPLSTLGLGAAGEVHKGVNLCHAIVLQTGTADAFHKYRSEVRGYCSDQGTEAAIANMGCALAAGAVDLGDWSAALKAAREGKLSTYPASFLLPRTLFIPDHLHIVFGCLEGAVKSIPAWGDLDTKLRAIHRLLRNDSHKTRFVATCLSLDVEKRALARHVGGLVDWKWEYMSVFLLSIRDILPILVARFDRAKFCNTLSGEGDMNKVDPGFLKDLSDALADPLLIPRCDVLRCVAFACDRQATTLEGCRCHEHALDTEGAWAERVRRYRQVSHGCVWKGRRALEMCAGGLSKITDAVGNASDRLLRETYANSTAEARQTMAALERTLKAHIQQQLKDKLGFWESLPYSLIGIIGFRHGMGTAADARALALRCIEEFDEAVLAGRREKLHRVATHFLDEGTALRAQIVAFGRGVLPLAACAHLECELLSYALVPCVSRRVEAVHSGIQGLKRKATRHSIPWLASKIRRKDVTAAMDTPSFMSWLHTTWNKRDIVRKSLSCVLSMKQLRAMSFAKVCGWWYQCLPESQFRDVQPVRDKLQVWSAVAKSSNKAEQAPVSDGEGLLVKYFKGIVAEPGVFWSAPKTLLELGLAAVDSPSDSRCTGTALVGRRLEQSQLGVLEVGDRVVNIVAALDPRQGGQRLEASLACATLR